MVVNIPVVDISSLFTGTPEQKLETAREIGAACKEVGFFIIVGHNVDQSTIDGAWSSTRDFFDLETEEKLRFTKPQHIYPFGYQGFGSEVLSAGKAAEQGGDDPIQARPPDLKEMFSLGPSDPVTGFPAREFPLTPAHFEEAWTNYYSTMFALASRLMRAFALTLGLQEEFFDSFSSHHASALRAINYPAVEAQMQPGQLRASAHTDYGTITILKSDGPGLQVSKDTSPPTWYNVPHVPDGFIINLGDLMRRWTNDEWLSTLHRVIVPSEEFDWNQLQASGTEDEATTMTSKTRRRQSLAFFHNVNRDALVEVLLDKEATPKHSPVLAGEFLMKKHLASTQAVL